MSTYGKRKFRADQVEIIRLETEQPLFLVIAQRKCRLCQHLLIRVKFGFVSKASAQVVLDRRSSDAKYFVLPLHFGRVKNVSLISKWLLDDMNGIRQGAWISEL